MRLLVLLGLLFTLPAHAAPEIKDNIKIAVVGPMSGPNANWGGFIKAGAELAADNINNNGGVLGKKIALEIFDDACDPKQAVTIANKIVASGIKFVAGHACSGATVAAADIYADENILMMTPTASNPALTDKGRWNIFRGWARDDAEGKVIGAYLKSKYAGRKLAMVDDKSTYGKSTAVEVKRALAGSNVNIVLEDKINPGEKDYTALVTHLKEAKADAVYYSGFPLEAGLIARQLRDQKSAIAFTAASTIFSDDFKNIAGAAAEGAVFAFPPNPARDPRNTALAKALKAKKLPEDTVTFYSYNVVDLLAQAMRAADSTDPKQVAAALHDRKFQTVLGNLSFDKNGDLLTPLFAINIWHNGKTEVLKDSQ